MRKKELEMKARAMYPALFIDEKTSSRDVVEYLVLVSKEIYPPNTRTINTGSFYDFFNGRKGGLLKRQAVIAYVLSGQAKLTMSNFLTKKRNDSRNKKQRGYETREQNRRAAREGSAQSC